MMDNIKTALSILSLLAVIYFGYLNDGLRKGLATVTQDRNDAVLSLDAQTDAIQKVTKESEALEKRVKEVLVALDKKTAVTRDQAKAIAAQKTTGSFLDDCKQFDETLNNNLRNRNAENN